MTPGMPSFRAPRFQLPDLHRAFGCVVLSIAILIASYPTRTDLSGTLAATLRAPQAFAQAQQRHIVHSPGEEAAEVDTCPVTTGPGSVDDPLRIEVGDGYRVRHARKRSAGHLATSKRASPILDGTQLPLRIADLMPFAAQHG